MAREDIRSTSREWKRLVKNPPRPNDLTTIRLLWTGALDILNDEDRNRKQQLVRDLDDEEFLDREHIQSILNLKNEENGATTFVKLVRPFLQCMTHKDALDCLAIDSAVGGIYNFISGSNGTSAVPFFTGLINSLNETDLSLDTPAEASILEQTFTSASICLREILRREQRVVFNNDLPDLITSYELYINTLEADFPTVATRTSSIFGEIRGMIARANGLINHAEPKVHGVSTSVLVSTFPSKLELPSGRHDNDKLDIAEI